MAAISVTGPLEGEAVDLGSTKMRILEDGSTTNGRLGVAVSTLAPHTAGPPQHLHGRHDEGFYVISGTARFTIGTESYDAPAGSLVMVPPGVAHTFDNPGDEPMVMLSTFSPSFYVQYFRDLATMIASGQPVTPKSAGAIMARYTTELAAALPTRVSTDPPERARRDGHPSRQPSQEPALTGHQPDHRSRAPHLPRDRRRMSQKSAGVAGNDTPLSHLLMGPGARLSSCAARRRTKAVALPRK